MDAILNCRMEDVEDYYELLGCDELSTVDQILAEFKVRALECHPDKNPEDPQAVENFQRLQKAKDILTNEESRDRYDYWRRSRVPIPFHQWEALSNSVKMSMHWAVRSKKEKMLKEPDPADTNNVTDEEGSQQKITEKGLSSTTERKEQGEPETLDKSWSPRSPDSSSFPDGNCWHLCFRWSGDTPSELLRKFRNYEI
ncbi:dnaJ homolog subfamily C member 12 isoform X2 [Phascolarctos cinereus]|uniref:DnaJ homolog subfamily C member 12 n=1 Tax=Phascolarctos cinereus TaxID=38626 RepID=A0A6P5LEF7_PHACI|nr:dnaJ homolog subfamily C member 12 isoform X1 [Phascolarctos cinereus]